MSGMPPVASIAPLNTNPVPIAAFNMAQPLPTQPLCTAMVAPITGIPSTIVPSIGSINTGTYTTRYLCRNSLHCISSLRLCCHLSSLSLSLRYWDCCFIGYVTISIVDDCKRRAGKRCHYSNAGVHQHTSEYDSAPTEHRSSRIRGFAAQPALGRFASIDGMGSAASDEIEVHPVVQYLGQNEIRLPIWAPSEKHHGAVAITATDTCSNMVRG